MSELHSVHVKTKYGAVSGIVQNGHFAWRGIPYAKAPVGALRFKRAVPCDPWESEKICNEFGSRPVQFGDDTTTSFWRESEDCLYMNIWAPFKAEKLPVFVYVHGGAWATGEGSSECYSAEAFARDGMIGVNFNYRVGPLGFANFNQFDENFDSNTGLSDILAALTWVKENIEAFGGDPENITVCGESAGAGNMLAVLASPASAGLFKRAVVMSALYKLYVCDKSHEAYAKDIMEYLKIDRNHMEKLREIPVEELHEANAAAVARTEYAFHAFYIGDDLLPEDPVKMLKNGAAKDVETIFGVCHDENSLFVAWGLKISPLNFADLEALLKRLGKENLMDEAKRIYQDESLTNMIRMGTDITFVRDTIEAAAGHSKYNKTYVYQQNYAITSLEEGFGAVHAEDIEFVLKTDSSQKSYVSRTDDLIEKWDEYIRVRDRFHEAVVHFAKTGCPDGVYSEKWPLFDDGKRFTMCLDTDGHVEEDPFGEGPKFIEKIWN